MNAEDLNLKTKMKLQELKNQRSGQMLQLSVSVGNDPSVNFSSFYNEILQLANMHKITPDELYLMGAHLQLMSVNVKQNAAGMVQKLTPEEKAEIAKEKEINEGKIRIKPDETIEVEPDKKSEPVPETK
jgi:hypothetical protein